MAFLPKSWANSPTTTTPLSAAALQDLETRVTAIGWGGVTIQTGNYTAVAGDVVRANPASGGLTITLPAPAASTTVSVIAYISVSGTNQVLVDPGTNQILNMGGEASNLSSAAIPLGSPGAFISLIGDGTRWYTVAGGVDTGWISLTAQTNWTVSALARQQGAQVTLRGTLTNNTGSPGSYTALLPTGIPVPIAASWFPVTVGGGVNPVQGNVTSSFTVPNTGTIASGTTVHLDGVTYATV